MLGNTTLRIICETYIDFKLRSYFNQKKFALFWKVFVEYTFLYDARDIF